MSNRSAKNIEYIDFLTSVKDEHDGFSAQKLQIPEFQRNYVWSKSNIKDLFISIKDNDKNYYFGNIVIIKDSSGRNKIVDGQQRLVTLSLVAKKLLEKTSNTSKKEILNNIIWADLKTPRILFQKDNLQTVYLDIISNNTFDENNIDESQRILINSFKCIEQECDSILDVDEFIEKIFSLEFVVIVSNSDEDAYQLFEGLNSTGLSLSAVELTKNSILGKIKSLDKTRMDEAIDIWLSIEKNFESTNILWFKKFLRHQWFSKCGYVGNSDLFREIKNNIINKQNVTINEIFDYLNELKKDSIIYIGFRTANLNKNDFNIKIHGEVWDNITKLVFFINQLGLDQIYSVLLAIYKYGSDQDDYFKRGETFQNHIIKIWKFLLIVKYTKVSPSSFEKDFSEICKKVQSKPYSLFKTLMDDFFEELSKKVNDLEDDFSKNFNNSIDYFVDDRPMVRFILEEYLTAEGVGSDSYIETEHIVPENNISKWKNVLDENKDMLKKSVGRLGNLTLLNKVLNNDAGDENFDDKFDAAYIKSRFTVNNELKNDWGEFFNSDNPLKNAIIPRGEKIGRTIYKKYLNELQ